MLFTIALFAGGVWLGWRLRIRYTDKAAAALRTELSEQEKKRQREDAQAFSQLANYSPELAYGIVSPDDIYDESE
jgi:hypothetical protein